MTMGFRISHVLATTLLAPALVLAQDETVREAPESTSSQSDAVATLATMGIGLLVVVALIFGCAWLIRRMNGLTGMNSGAMKVVSVMALGARERIALIDVAGTQILVGITPSSIRTLHVFDEPVVVPGQAVSGDFAKKLHGLMGRHWKPGDAGRKGDTD
ncbi:flagellar protein FliO/FliZ [Marinobacter segnicrescens]|uniref:Flagellar protein n=2 Tax=Marinobacter segnicrescens TaxID=430453 RepID=A0A1H9Z5T3_9GAMM|nr:flagellar protein FliO/FliZ [Marinobacter segnicrescens]